MIWTWTSPLAVAALLTACGLFWLCFGIGTYWLSRSGRDLARTTPEPAPAGPRE